MTTQTVTATEANRSFSKLLDAVKRGECVEITSHGRKVAIIAPIVVKDEEAARVRRIAAFENLKRYWATCEHVTVGPWTRDELNERDGH